MAATTPTFSASHLISFSSDNRVQVWEVASSSTPTIDKKADGKSSCSMQRSLHALSTLETAEGFKQSCCWSHDNEFFVTASSLPVKEKISIQFWSAQGSKVLHEVQRELPTTAPGAPCAQIIVLKLFAKSRKLVAAFDSGFLDCFDLRDNKWSCLCRLQIRQEDRLAGIALSADEQWLVLATRKGQVYACALDLQMCSEMKPHLIHSQSNGINQIGFSHFKKTVMALTCTNGQVSLYNLLIEDGDARSLDLIHSFDTHKDTITGLCFSPFNRYLMVTAGKDHRLVLYDVERKTAVRTIRTLDPLTSLSFNKDGVVIAVGSAKGSIFLYDLSARGKSPVFTLETSGASVDGLWFMNPTRSSHRSSIANMSKNDSTKPTPFPKESAVASPDAGTVSANPNMSMNYMAMFSPVKSSAKEVVKPRKIPEIQQPIFERKLPTLKQLEEKLDQTAANKENNRTDKVQTPFIISKKDILKPPEISLAGTVHEFKKEKPISVPELKTEAFEALRQNVTAAVKDSLLPVETQILNSKNENLDDMKPDDDRSNTSSSLINNEKHKITVSNDEFPTILQSPRSSDSGSHKKDSVPSNNASHPPMHFNMKILTNAIDKALDSFRLELRQDIQNFHLEMLRQFEYQQQDFVDALQQAIQTVRSDLQEADNQRKEREKANRILSNSRSYGMF